MNTKKQMIRTELEEIVELCKGSVASQESAYMIIGRIQAKAERALRV